VFALIHVDGTRLCVAVLLRFAQPEWWFAASVEVDIATRPAGRAFFAALSTLTARAAEGVHRVLSPKRVSAKLWEFCENLKWFSEFSSPFD
jgi:hypothetical protein